MAEPLNLTTAITLLRQAGVALPDPKDKSIYLQAVVDALCELTATDPLTGALNRRSFLPILERELDRVTRVGEQALLIAVDIDHFKRVNDQFGHLAGDEVIKQVAECLKQSIRPMDSVARMGGEEFCVVCPNCPPAFARVVAERIRSSVADTAMQMHQQPPLHVTVSCGAAFATPWVKGQVSEWLDRADRLLYQAKSGGRNQVCIEDVLTPEVSAEEKGLLFGWGETETRIISGLPSQ